MNESTKIIPFRNLTLYRESIVFGAIAISCALTTAPELSYRVPALIGQAREGSPLGLSVFSFVWGLTVVAIWVTARFAPASVRLVYGVIVFLSAVVISGYYLAMSEAMEVSQFDRMLEATTFVIEALKQYSRSALVAVGISIPLLLFMLFLPRRDDKPRVALLTPFLPLVAVIPILAIGWVRGGEGTAGMPAIVRVPAYIAMLTTDRMMGSTSQPPIEPSAKADTTLPPLEDVVLVVDESVVSDVFEQGNELAIEPKFGQLSRVVVDFGPITSGANCSADSNHVLRFGPRQGSLKKDLAAYPPIWAYARAAGYRTLYIDLQEGEERLHNRMTGKERQLIDEYLVAGHLPVSERDGWAGDEVRKRLANGQRDFIYVNKVGAHFPWDSMYPSGKAHYTPSLGIEGDRFLAHAGGQRSDLWIGAEAAAGTIEARNSYRNATEWNLNSFFAPLTEGGWPIRSVVVYTSDHGQNVVKEDGRSNTHCSSSDAAKSEGRVPLIILTAQPYWNERISSAATKNKGRVSHYNLFSTLTMFMGYGEDFPVDVREPPVWADEPSPNGMRFATRIPLRFGAEPVFRVVCAAGERLGKGGRCTPS